MIIFEKLLTRICKYAILKAQLDVTGNITGYICKVLNVLF